VIIATKTPNSAKEFQAICAESGQKARCCGLSEIVSCFYGTNNDEETDWNVA
jgi:hypothetical protein